VVVVISCFCGFGFVCFGYSLVCLLLGVIIVLAFVLDLLDYCYGLCF